MKAKYFLTLLATALTLSISASSNTQSVINESTILPVISHKTIYATSDVFGNIKWECDYDAAGRLVSKTGYVRTDNSGEWMPRVAYSVFYNTDETIVTSGRWNAAQHNFRTGAIQRHYAANSCPDILK